MVRFIVRAEALTYRYVVCRGFVGRAGFVRPWDSWGRGIRAAVGFVQREGFSNQRGIGISVYSSRMMGMMRGRRLAFFWMKRLRSPRILSFMTP